MTNYYYFDLLGQRDWNEVSLDGHAVKPLAGQEFVTRDDVVFAHLSDLVFGTKNGFEKGAEDRLGVTKEQAIALNQEREKAIQAFVATSEQFKGSPPEQRRWYFYSGDPGGAKGAFNGYWPHKQDFPSPSQCQWGVLTSQPLAPRANKASIEAWAKELLEPSQPHVEQMEQLFRLFLDTELYLSYREQGNLPEKLKSLVMPKSLMTPNWQRYFDTAASLAKERSNPEEWPFSVFSSDITNLAEAFRVRCANGEIVFVKDDALLIPYAERWMQRYS